MSGLANTPSSTPEQALFAWRKRGVSHIPRKTRPFSFLRCRTSRPRSLPSGRTSLFTARVHGPCCTILKVTTSCFFNRLADLRENILGKQRDELSRLLGYICGKCQ